MNADAAALSAPEAAPCLHRAGAIRALGWATALTLSLHLLPMLLPGWGLRWLQWPLLLLSSLVHELGHGLTALLLGGDFANLRLWRDGSGVAGYRGAFSALSLAMISAGGLLGPPLVALALLLAGRRQRGAHLALAGSALMLVVVVIFWAANLFTVIFCLVLAAPLALMAWRGPPAASQILCVFVAIQLGLASFARADYLFMPTASTGAGAMPSDVAQIADALWLPYWIWGGLIAMATVGLLALGTWRFLRALS